MKKKTNPIVQRVISTFDNVKLLTKSFITKTDSIIRGIAIPGDAGLGKTKALKDALKEIGLLDDVAYVKGGSITPGALFVMLYLNRFEGCLVALDDVNISDLPSTIRNEIMEMIKGATDPDSEMRTISYERAVKNELMKKYNVPTKFRFDGKIIWITNNTIEDIKRTTKSHFAGLFSRFQWAPCFFNEDEKLQYTLWLIEEIDILGKNCDSGIKVGGFSEDVIQKTYDYIYENYEKISDISPRQALKIAELIDTFPNNWEEIVKLQCENLY
jgi:hypothetical protein